MYEFKGMLYDSRYAMRQTYLDTEFSITGYTSDGTYRADDLVNTGSVRGMIYINEVTAMVYTKEGVYCVVFTTSSALNYVRGMVRDLQKEMI